MAKTKVQKESIYQTYKDSLGTFKSFILVDMTHVKTKAVEQLKESLRQSTSEYVLVKNTLFRKAVKARGIQMDLENLQGVTGVIFGHEDPSAALKELMRFANENKTVTVKTGFIEQTVYSQQEITELAKLPGRSELISKFIGTAKAPLSNIVSVAGAVNRNFLYTLKAIETTK